MRAMIITETGLELRDVPTPRPGPDEVLVRVHAAGLNRAELAMAAGHAHGSHGGAGTGIGLEWAGEVAEIGTNVTEFKPGDRVMASGNGGYAEYAVTDSGRVNAVPDSNMGWVQAATLPIALQTMHDALATNGALQAGQAVLIQGASSGVGLIGLQIARELGATTILGASRNLAHRKRLPDFGATGVVDTEDDGWPRAVLDATGGEGVDLVVDMVSAPVSRGNLQATRIKGRIVNVGRLGGQEGAFDFDLHAARRISYIGVTFRTRSVEEVREINRRMRAALWPALEAGRLALPVDRIFPLQEANQALHYMSKNQHLGKIVLTV